jgi:hypothetical protein
MARRIPVIRVSLLAGLAGLLAAAFFLSAAAGRLLERLSAGRRLGRLFSKVQGFREVVVSYRRKPGSFLLALAWALVLQVNVVVYYFLVGRALGIGVPLLDYFVFIPIVLLVQTVPLTIGGLGLRESAYVTVFRFYGVGPGTAVSFSLAADVAVGLAVGIVGGIIYVTRK